MVDHFEVSPLPGRLAIDALVIDDIDAKDLLNACLAALDPPSRFSVAALHIGSLVSRDTPGFGDAIASFDRVYPDGYSVKIAASLAGAKKTQRMATTDLVNSLLGRLPRLRVAIIGGEAGVAVEAGEALSRRFGTQLVYCADGYCEDWSERLVELRTSNPQLILVGMGMPLEANWFHQHRDNLPVALVITCGGLLRILAGHERRAPLSIQRARLEWLYRLITDPRRTWRRYLLGFVVCLRLYPRLLLLRLSTRGGRR